MRYKITSARPKDFFLQVVYEEEGKSDFHKNFTVYDFSDESVKELIQSFVPNVLDYWEKQETQPEDILLAEQEGELKPLVYSAIPNLEETQKAVPKKVEYADKIVIEYDVVPYSPEEMSSWRSTFQVSMRQARLALLQYGLLEQVNSAIASMEEPAKTLVETEWEYASVVDRGSPWMGQMATALGLTDEQLDELFKLAATL